ncbi:acetylglutamate kinase [Anaerocolumna sedimenticola]|uniref:Acetylglutamate kinase n=1 Tax=Anaerocolumna sedimenticola TaxID=2696063 RepID=A0A6P1TN55_9FIRM|nr:acetylglutamate kinase [Anaerocolumna sedimenticola]QHQ61757.1 acetylglutamate kinase [Anaerocolumna sedimenticola]
MLFNNNNLSNCKNQINVFNAFRKLWEQHVFWTRTFIISTASNLGDLELVTERLLRNPTDFAIVLKNFYSADKARTFEGLLKEHLLIAASLVNNTKNGNTEAAYEDRKKWHKNADEIALFLGEINPHWSPRQFRALLYEHLKMTEDEAVYRLNGKYASDIALFDSIETQALQMADFMAFGILNQFFLNPMNNSRQ